MTWQAQDLTITVSANCATEGPVPMEFAPFGGTPQLGVDTVNFAFADVRGRRLPGSHHARTFQCTLHSLPRRVLCSCVAGVGSLAFSRVRVYHSGRDVQAPLPRRAAARVRRPQVGLCRAQRGAADGGSSWPQTRLALRLSYNVRPTFEPHVRQGVIALLSVTTFFVEEADTGNKLVSATPPDARAPQVYPKGQPLALARESLLLKAARLVCSLLTSGAHVGFTRAW